MAGGLSRAFVLPLLVAYLFFVSQDKMLSAGLVILIQSFFNPYVFLLCLFTHAFIMFIKFAPTLFPNFVNLISNVWSAISRLTMDASPAPIRESSVGIRPGDRPKETNLGIIKKILIVNAPVFLGVAFIVANDIWYQSVTGHLISWVEMIGKSEYSEFGRFELYPEPSFFSELIRPWIFNLSFPYWGLTAGWIMAIVVVGTFAYAITNYRPVIVWIGLKGFLFLIPASLLLYAFARIFLVKLFVPTRYIYYTLNLLYCIGFALALRIILEKVNIGQFYLYAVLSVLIVFACIKTRHVEFYDYSDKANLYKFVQTIPKNSLVAGFPEVMDDVMTFGKRPAYVTYELSHTWVQPYWGEVKKRTFELFGAYYSSSPQEIKKFCESNDIKYLIVRLDDFHRERLEASPVYFEPFNGYIWSLASSTNYFAVLDKSVFPPIFEENGIRVLRIR